MSRRITSVNLYRVREIANAVWSIAAAVFMICMIVGAAAFAVLMFNLIGKTA